MPSSSLIYKIADGRGFDPRLLPLWGLYEVAGSQDS